MCENVRGDLEALSFAMDEVRLFLDTHPTNTCALKAYRELRVQRDAAVKAYEAVGLVDDNVHLRGPLFGVGAGQVPHRFGIAFNKRQRRAQVMADVGEQVPLQLVRTRHLPRHGIEILRKHSQFIVPARGDTRGIIPFCHTPRRT